MSDDYESPQNLPLPPLGSETEPAEDADSFPGLPRTDFEKITLPGGDSTAFLDEIPYPMEMETEDQDIPLPPDSSKYSPSQAGAEEEMMEGSNNASPAQSSDSASNTPSGSAESSSNKPKFNVVLGKAAAKKRLAAFSSQLSQAKLAASTKTKSSSIKGITVFHQSSKSKSNPHEGLAIVSIKQEEEKMKEVMALNTILSEKLKQVSEISTSLPKPPPVTAVVTPTILNQDAHLRVNREESASNNLPVVIEKNISQNNGDAVDMMRSPQVTPIMAAAKNNLQATRGRSISRSRSRSHSKSDSPSHSRKKRSKRERSKSRERDRSRRDRDRRSRSTSTEKQSKARDQQSANNRVRRSRSRDRSRRSRSVEKRSFSRDRERDRRSRRSRSRSKDKSRSRKDKDKRRSSVEKGSKSRRSRSRSNTPQRMKDRKRSKSRSKSPSDNSKRNKDKNRSRRSTSRERDRESSDRRKEREQLEKERKQQEILEREKREKARKEAQKEKEREEQHRREMDRVRRSRMPLDWTDFQKYEFDFDNVRRLWTQMKDKETRDRSNSRSSDEDMDKREPTQRTPLTKSLQRPLKPLSGLHVDLRDGSKWEYPAEFLQKTNVQPSITYGINPLSYDGLYKSREQIKKEETPEILNMMMQTISSTAGKKNESGAFDSHKSRGWFSSNETTFCPPDGSKGVLISHLYSDDMEDSLPESVVEPANVLQTNLKLIKEKKTEVTINSDAECKSKSSEGTDSMDSAPSPLLKKRYEHEETHVVENLKQQKRKVSVTDDESASSENEESRRKDYQSQQNNGRSAKKGGESTKDRTPSERSKRPSDKVRDKRSKNVESDDDYPDDMEEGGSDFQLEKEIINERQIALESSTPISKAKSPEPLPPKSEEASKSKGEKKSKDKKEKKHSKKSRRHHHHKISKKKSRHDSSPEDEEGSSDEEDVKSKKTKEKEKKKSRKLDRDEKESKRKEKKKDKRSRSTESSKSSDGESDDSSSKRSRKRNKRTKISVKEKEPEKTGKHDISLKSEKVIDSDRSLSGERKPKASKERDKSSDNKKGKEFKQKDKSKHKKKHSKNSRGDVSVSSSTDGKSSSRSSSSSSSSSDEENDSKRKRKKHSKKKSDKDDKKKDKDGHKKDKDGDGGGGSRSGGGDTGSSHNRDRDHKSQNNRDRQRRHDDHKKDKDRHRRHSGGRKREYLGDKELPITELNHSEELASIMQEELDPEKLVASMIEKITIPAKSSLPKPVAPNVEADALISALEDDELLNSILQNKDVNITDILLKSSSPQRISTPKVEQTVIVRVKDQTAEIKHTVTTSCSWSDDSQDGTTVSKSSENLSGIMSSGYGTEKTEGAKSGEGASSGSSSSGSSSSSSGSSSSSSSGSTSSGSSSDSSGSSSEEETETNKEKVSADLSATTSSVSLSSSKVQEKMYDPFKESSESEIDEHRNASRKPDKTPTIPQQISVDPTGALPIPTVLSTDTPVVNLSFPLEPNSDAKERVGIDVAIGNSLIAAHEEGNSRHFDEEESHSNNPRTSSVGHSSRSSSRSPSRDRSRSHYESRPRSPPSSNHRHRRRSGSSDSGHRRRDEDRRRRRRSKSPSPGSGRSHYKSRHRDDRDRRRRDRDRDFCRVRRRRSRSPRSRSRSASPRDIEGRYASSRWRDREELGVRRHGRRLGEERERGRRDYHDRGGRDFHSPREDLMSHRRKEFEDILNKDGYYSSVHGALPRAEESPPLQLNIADSTISDSELAAGMMHPLGGTPIEIFGGISKEALFEHNQHANSQNLYFYPPHPDVGHSGDEFPASHFEYPDHVLHQQQSHFPAPEEQPPNDYEFGGGSPKRLSLDERLEKEMGIKLMEEPQSKGLASFQQQQTSSSGPVVAETTEVAKLKIQLPWGQGHQKHSQVTQVGDIVQVVPAELQENVVFKAPDLSTMSRKQRLEHINAREFSTSDDGTSTKRTVTIKVPVVPFKVPILPTMEHSETLPAITSSSPVKQKKKKRRKTDRASKVNEDTIVGETENTKRDNSDNVESKGSQNTILQEHASSILKEDVKCSPQEETKDTISPTDVVQEANRTDVEHEDLKNANEGAKEIEDAADAIPDLEKIEKAEKESAAETIKRAEEALKTNPSRGILVSAGFRERTEERLKLKTRGVTFKDGINPGDGTSSSGGEEMASPPPPSADVPKKIKVKRKKKPKVKSTKSKNNDNSVSTERPSSPAPIPSVPYPYCPIGILFQVNFPYATVYAEAVAEKGFDIVFQPSDQLPNIGDQPCEAIEVERIIMPEPQSVDRFKENKRNTSTPNSRTTLSSKSSSSSSPYPPNNFPVRSLHQTHSQGRLTSKRTTSSRHYSAKHSPTIEGSRIPTIIRQTTNSVPVAEIHQGLEYNNEFLDHSNQMIYDIPPSGYEVHENPSPAFPHHVLTPTIEDTSVSATATDNNKIIPIIGLGTSSPSVSYRHKPTGYHHRQHYQPHQQVVNKSNIVEVPRVEYMEQELIPPPASDIKQIHNISADPVPELM